MGQMTPVTHDSADWRDLNRKVDELSKGQAQMQTQIESLERQQDAQHRENKEEIASMKTILLGDGDTPGLKTLMYAINSNLNLLKWLIGILIGALTIYYASREVRGKVAEVQTGHVQQQHDAGLPFTR
jgi:ribosomal protein L29